MRKMALFLVMTLVLSCIPATTLAENDTGEIIEVWYNEEETGSDPTSNDGFSDNGYCNKGCLVTVAEFPSEKEKSLKIQPQAGAENFIATIKFEKSDVRKAVFDVSLAYNGVLCSKKNIFTVHDGTNSHNFLTMDTNGLVSLYNGEPVVQMESGSFCRLSISIDLDKDEFEVYVNGIERLIGRKMPVTLKSISASFISVHSITGDTEEFYIKYHRGYEGVKLKNDYYVKPVKKADESVYDEPAKINVDDKYIQKRMKDVVLLSGKTNRASLSGTLTKIDDEDDSIKPCYAGDTLMVPAEFLKNALALEGTVSPDSAELSFKGNSISLIKDNASATANGNIIILSAAPAEINGQLYIPVKEACEYLGKSVEIMESSGVCVITNTNNKFDLDKKEELKVFYEALKPVIYEYPTSEDIIADFNENITSKQHPRLLMTPEKVEALRVKVKTEEPYISWMSNVIKKANSSLVNTPGIEYVLADGIRMAEVGMKVTEYVANLGLAYQITQETKYADKAIEVLLKACGEEFPDWHPYHFLDVAEMAIGVALGYDWCYDRMTEEERKIVRDGLINNALLPVMDDYLDLPRERTWYWSNPSSEAYPQNWIDVCFGGTAMAALAIADEELPSDTLAADVIREGLLRRYDFGIKWAPDGAFGEGTMYWSYAYNKLIPLLDSMWECLGTDYGITNLPGFDDSFLWLAQMTGPAGVFNYFSEKEPLNTPPFFWLGKFRNDDSYTNWRLEKMKERGDVGGYLDILWYTAPESNESAELSMEFSSRAAGEISLRSGFEKEDTYLACYRGIAKESTTIATEKEGTFVLDMLGERWAESLGRAYQVTYMNTGYQRIEAYRNRPEGNNTVLIQPSSLFNYNPYVAPKILRLEGNELSNLAVIDFTEKLAYKGATKWYRGFKLDKETGKATIQDELTASKKIEYYWFMHTMADIKILADGCTAILSQNGKQVVLRLNTDVSGMRFKVMEAKALETSPVLPSNAEDDNSMYKKLVVHGDGIKKVNMSVEIEPLFGDAYGESEEFVPMIDWRLKENSDFDRALTLSGIMVDGVSIKNFAPNDTQYLFDKTIGDTIPNVTASSDAGEIEVIAPVENNKVAKIIVKDTYTQKRNEYTVSVSSYDFKRPFAEFVEVEPDIISKAPQDAEKIVFKTIKADYIPQAQNSPENLFDGDPVTRYSVDKLGSYVEFDIGEEKKIDYMSVAHNTGARNELMVVATSQDGVKWTILKELKTNSSAGTELQVYKTEPTLARYVRLYDCGTSESNADRGWWSLGEFALYSKR